ncbi:AMP-binding protein [Rickettsiella endosymbiont of Aleochara curtula]|uniref:AMP-binding protein n=1 Tax=Rickettsiella endosymbiont of Aleochara curtula TaxID=3077936 RepID=UPI00313EC358
MLILSTFNSDYLQAPLSDLSIEFDREALVIEYVETNLKVALLELQQREKKPAYCTILLRLCDLVENTNKSVGEQLDKNLNTILGQIIELKKGNDTALIVFLCPSTNNSLPNVNFKSYDEKIWEVLKENKIHLLTYKYIEKEYKLKYLENIPGSETHIPFTPEYYNAIAGSIAEIGHLLQPNFIKLVTWDFDGVLVSGIIGEDGLNNIKIEEHTEAIHNHLCNLWKEGRVNVINSKNTSDKISLIGYFIKNNRATLLREKHFIMEENKINLDPKSYNIMQISASLGITLDQILFIDDNEDELNEVRNKLPAVICVKAPQNMEEFNESLFFRTNKYLHITETDRNRTEFYKKQSITSSKTYCINDFLDELEIYKENSQIVQVTPEQQKEIERISELTNRTNQFNLFRAPKNEKQIKTILTKENNVGFLFTEKQQDPGIKSEVGLGGALCRIEDNCLLVTDFFISCRAFTKKMGIEYILIKYIGEYAENNNLEWVKIQFKKTDKNKIIAVNFLTKLIENKLCKDEISSNNFTDEMEIDFFSNKLKNIDVNNLTILTNNFNQLKSVELPEISNDVIESNREYYQSTIRLQKKISKIKNHTSKHFLNADRLTLVKSLEKRVNIICNHLLGEEEQVKSLVARGLDSLKATELRYYLYESEQVNITIPKLLCEETTPTRLVEYIKSQKTSLEVAVKNDSFYNVTLPVSFQQQRIWFAEQQESADNSANYHMIACYKVSKSLNVKNFERACQKLIEVYDVFGTSFSYQNDKLTQLILSPEARHLSFQVKELKPQTSLEEAIQLEISNPWTMQSKDPLIRFVIFEATQNYHIFIHVHHAIFDAVSLKNCLDTLSKLYQHLFTSNLSEFTYCPPQYIEFIRKQQELENKACQAKSFDFWKNKLSKIEMVTTLPFDQPLSTFKPATEQTAKRFTFSLPPEDLLALKNLAKSAGVTCFIVLKVLYTFLIASYTYQKNIMLITASNGRGGRPSFDKMVGFFVNLLVQPFDFEKNQNFVEYLKQINEEFLASQEFQDIPFNKLQEILSAQGVRDVLSSPAFIYQAYGNASRFELGDEIAELEIPKQPIIFDLRKTCRFGAFTLFAQENELALNFVIEYAQDLFTLPFIEGFAKNFIHTIMNVKSNQSLHEISVVCGEQRAKLAKLGEGPKHHYPENRTLVSKFQQTVEKHPNNAALCYNNESLTYKEVDQKSTDLAYALYQKGVKRGDLVGIHLTANHLFFIAELAILKLGAVFVPLSPEHPAKYLKSIINDSKINTFVIDNNTASLFDQELATYKLISIESEYKNISIESLPPLVKTINDRFCILYTSGSTGTPKGVILLEKGILRVVESPNFIKVSPESKIAQTADQAFDAAQLECWLALVHGASLEVCDKETCLDSNLLQKKILDKNITHIWLTAPVFNVHVEKKPEMFSKVDCVMVGGAPVPKEKVQVALKQPNPPIIINGYGPTETTVFALVHPFDKQTLPSFVTSPIGRPINNTNVQILTPFGTIAPSGAIGQLCIAGDGVSEGYLNLEDLNNEKFIVKLNQKWYLSGDLVTIMHDQMLFLCRATNTAIKWSGHWVDLEGVRMCLSAHEAIQNVAIIPILKSEMNDENVIAGVGEFAAIVAFYTLKKSFKKENTNSPTHQEFVSYLRKHLPFYGAVSAYCKVEELPLKVNGKIDENKLKDDYKLMRNYSKGPENINGFEKTLLKKFKEVLPDFPDSLDTDFFAWGGNSLQAMLLINNINDSFVVGLKPRDLYENPTIALLSNLIKKPKNHPKKSRFRLLKKGNDNLPAIVFIHPAGGGISCFSKLLEKVTFDNSCYGIEDPVLDNETFKPLTMEEMAANYYCKITKELQRPIVIGGFSFGGLLAWKIAELFEKKSENNFLSKLFLFDTWVVSCTNQLIKDKLIKEVLVHCAEQRQKANINENFTEIVPLLEKLCDHHQKIGFEFKPPKLNSTPVTLFQAVELNKNFLAMSAQDGGKNNYLLEFLHDKLFTKHKIEANHYNLLEINNSSLTDSFSSYVNEINLELDSKPCKQNKVSMALFRPLAELNNDPQFSCLKPKMK